VRMIITGAASGIGLAVARLAAGSGAHLILADRSPGVMHVASELDESTSGSAFGVIMDLRDPEDIQRTVDIARDRFGGLDALVSNAGVNPPASLLELSPEAFDSSFAINTRPTWLLGRAAHPLLKDSGGAIVATVSMSATQPTPPLGAYSASKAALLMLVQQMALEWGPDGIRCNCVSPGPTVTGMTAGVFNDLGDDRQRENRRRREEFIPLRHVGDAEDVARAILFLASSASKQITGVNLLVDGGLSLGLMPAVGGGQGHEAKATTK
jgi:NAD(P)-dependent dehydrogenase (short-subunit alcohol dehydrogenase family)